MPVSKNNRKKSKKKPSRAIIEKREAARKKIAEAAEAAEAAKPSRPTGATGSPRKPMLLPDGLLAKGLSSHTSKDLTKDGKCSGCGGCCSSILPVTDAEASILKDYADTHGIDPELPAGTDPVIYLQCPFLDKTDKKCLVYPVRPGICRSYRCNKTDAEILKDYLRTTSQKGMPITRNMWELFGRTGLRTAEGEITPENANRAELVDPAGKKYPVQVGRPISFTTKSGKRYVAALCLNLKEEAMEIFNDSSIETVNYLDIDSVI